MTLRFIIPNDRGREIGMLADALPADRSRNYIYIKYSEDVLPSGSYILVVYNKYGQHAIAHKIGSDEKGDFSITTLPQGTAHLYCHEAREQ